MNESWREVKSDAEAEEFAAGIEDFPVRLGMEFCSALKSGDKLHLLPAAVTPESRDYWGDFQWAVEKVRSIQRLGYGSIADRAAGEDRVAYFKLISKDIEEPYQVNEDVPMVMIDAAAILTIVQRPDGQWRVHHLGDYVLPEDAPL
ncbi:hypothetical protein RD149_16145 [Gordonia westfalica]|uniref:SnoaL-like domain-containing protein n=1 Tax=Gordonia westfalica TaxID=158898 RepID=A0ABU2GWK7_9ACTN|nr:hypothetical protein [Gordonia westfalica]MDS1115290.1 hypothetical protein [Gordonia westfalica]